MNDFLIRPNTRIDLSQYETYYTGEIKRKAGRKKVVEYRKVMRDLQELLYAENKQKILVVLQGIDTSGKDGTIKNVFGDVNPQGTKVANFRVPTSMNLPVITSGECTRSLRQEVRSSFLIAPITRMYWSSGLMSLPQNRSGKSATSISTNLNVY